MSCRHLEVDEQFELTWCKTCGAIRHRESSAWMLPLRARCPHAAVGLTFFLHPNSGPDAKQLEWCPGCGAYRFRPGGEWVAPYTQ